MVRGVVNAPRALFTTVRRRRGVGFRKGVIAYSDMDGYRALAPFAVFAAAGFDAARAIRESPGADALDGGAIEP